MVAEFDDVAGWTADAVEQLGIRHAIPAACRGSSSPAGLAWLAEACELVVVARSPQSLPAPDGNHFPTQDELAALLTRTGFTLLEQTSRPDDAPLSWSRRVEQVTAVVAARPAPTRWPLVKASDSAASSPQNKS
jgi:hypothetical protein